MKPTRIFEPYPPIVRHGTDSLALKGYVLGMASTVPVPAPSFCAERQRLIAEFTLAASEHLQALSEQLKSVALGNGFEFEAEIPGVRLL
jgi:hypothetical protein